MFILFLFLLFFNFFFFDIIADDTIDLCHHKLMIKIEKSISFMNISINYTLISSLIMNWSETPNYLKGISNKLNQINDPVRIAAFDLDDTLFTKKKHKGKSVGWKLIDESITKKISDLVMNKYIIVIFTNQKGMGTNKNFNKPKWINNFNELLKVLMTKVKNDKYYLAIYASKMDDMYRKPNMGMWEQMKIDIQREFNLVKIRVSKKSFYCGDAAGRIKNGYYQKKLHPTSKKQGDFSDTDRKFALNIGIDFYTPEEFYLDNPEDIPYKFLGLDPAKFVEALYNKKDNPQLIVNVNYNKIETINVTTDSKYQFIARKKEMIVMIGQMGAGKTDFVNKYILPKGYVHISKDKCKSTNKCLTETKNALEKGKSVVIDNTNPDVVSRMNYTSLAKDYGYKHIRAIEIKIPNAIARHLNNVRHIYSKGKIPKVNKIAYNVFRSKYVKPLESEYFDKIETLDFIFDKEQLNDPLWKKIFLKWSEA